MNDVNKLLNILELDGTNINSLTSQSLKIQYYKLARKYHPDKNKQNAQYTEYFQKIGDAYTKLSNIINNTSYKEDENNITEEIALKIFEKFVKENKTIIDLGVTIVEKLHKYLTKKDTPMAAFGLIYILHPSLDDLMEDKVFRLSVQDSDYFVPLWHSDLSYNTPQNEELIVKCIPKLPQNIKIDENNNIIYDVSMPFPSLQDEYFGIQIGKQMFNIYYANLRITSKQIFIFHNQGIARISENAIYTTTQRADIILNIIFTERC
jgi:curved DNA-binding protein CbpA